MTHCIWGRFSSKYQSRMITMLMIQLIAPRVLAGLGASGEGGARAGARPEERADQAGEAGTDGQKVRQEGCHEGDLAPGEPETSSPGRSTITQLQNHQREEK